jgi:hypothetical protein
VAGALSGADGAVAGRVGGGAVVAPSIGRATATLAAGAPLCVASSISFFAKCCSGEEEEGGAGFYTPPPPLVPAGGFNRD